MTELHSWREPRLLGRREMLQGGALGVLGLSLPQLLAGRSAHAATTRRSKLPGFGKAKSCIFIYQVGGAPQQDTFDMKPDVPSEVRSAYKPIASSLPGFSVCEHLPLLARQAHRLAVVRSVHHKDTDHNSAGYIALTGNDHSPAVFSLSGRGPQPDDRPHFGAVVTKLRGTAAPWVALPFESSNALVLPGQSAGFLGPRYEPLWVKDDVNAPDFRQSTLGLSSEMTPDRLSQRRGLMGNIDKAYDRLARTAATAEMTACQSRALDLITATKTHEAFQLDRESDRLRTRYGRTLFGQSCLLARRLVEAGIPLVLIESFGADGFPRGSHGWDMHAKIFDELKDEVFPVQDRGFAVLLEDLAGRGLLDETLVVWTTEFGRSPMINQYAGRDHWPFVYTVLFAGAGVQAGVVYGSSDKIAAYPATNPVTPQDLAATIYHCLGIDPRTRIHDQQGRAFEVGIGGEPIRGILG